MAKSPGMDYRKDIDGLRAIAVLAVFLFHLGFLPNGYLGVDVFFAISGFLITKIVYNEAIDGVFSIYIFYLRRIRRIIPLVLFTTLVALIIGLIVMLPDDLENLCQSVFATNFFANNILLLITSGNYWAIANEYKPLMHTWSLGIEEQFYLFYPLLFLILKGNRKKLIVPILILLTFISFCLFVTSTNEATRFYSIQYRFFELSLGGVAAIIWDKRALNENYKIIFLSLTIFLLLVDIKLSSILQLAIIVASSVGLLIKSKNKTSFYTAFLENKTMVGIGRISFSIYMWHQIIIAYTRYFITDELRYKESIVIFIIVIGLSILSYFLIEQPFRSKEKIKTKLLLGLCCFIFIAISSASYYLYFIGGIIRDVPELELYKSQKNNTNHNNKIHSAYNLRIHKFNKNFTGNDKINILIIGNSFARDFANILLANKSSNKLEISYTVDMDSCKEINERLKKAQFVFFSDIEINQFKTLENKYRIDRSKIWIIGTKNFGRNNGIFYNKRRDNDYCNQRVYINTSFTNRNDSLKSEWGNKYIDLIGLLKDKNGTLPIFTNECKFISQDCSHLTPAGALFYSNILNLNWIFETHH